MLVCDTVPTREQSRAAELASRARKLSITDGQGDRRTWDSSRIRINEGILQYHFAAEKWHDIGRVETLIANGWTIEPSPAIAFVEDCQYRGSYAIEYELRSKFHVYADSSAVCVISRTIGTITTLWAMGRTDLGDWLADELYRAVGYVGCGNQREEITDSDGNVGEVPSAKVALCGEDGYSFGFRRYTPVTPERYRETFNDTIEHWSWTQRKSETETRLRINSDLEETNFKLNCSVAYRFQFNGGIIQRWDLAEMLEKGIQNNQRGWSIHT